MSQRQRIVAVYPGTFDPLTLGHEDILKRAAGMFDELVLAVAVAHHKRTMFSLDERLALAAEVTAPLGNVRVDSYRGLLRDYCLARGVRVVVRGVRAATDFDYEFQMAGMNRHLMPGVDTIFLTPQAQTQFISSTFVREIATLGGDVAALVSPSVLKRLQERVAQAREA
ncbi:pantetheine-phosphate adenylyltransferase [Burkholderiales bacterium JOSHI_001]|nr:pantetheine-phosphate adenylyltransferase [Burkholderiales bacterium JOSHI_001]